MFNYINAESMSGGNEWECASCYSLHSYTKLYIVKTYLGSVNDENQKHQMYFTTNNAIDENHLC